MTIFTAWILLSIGCSIGFVAGSLFTSQRDEGADRVNERHSGEAFFG